MMTVKRYAMWGLLVVALVCPACTTVEGTGRKQFMLVTESQEQQMGRDAYQQILSKETLSSDARMTGIVRRVGERIAAVVNRPDFAWEFNLIESPQVNAFCLPGGKIAVYTGILPMMENEAGMAAVMGHEVAHAVARHGGERVTTGIVAGAFGEVVQYGFRGASPAAQSAAMQAYGITANVGAIMPFGRSHESEADSLGLVYAAKAGYDPREAVALWRRMKAASKNRPPEFLSTHPSTDRRIEDLQGQMSEAMGIYDSGSVRYGLGDRL